MRSTVVNKDIEQARAKVRGALRTTRWLRRIAVLLALVIAVLVLSIKVQGQI